MSEKIWVSLTTLPERINNIYDTINSIKQQSTPPDKINLCVPYICSRNNEEYIPDILLNDKDVNIVRCNDY